MARPCRWRRICDEPMYRRFTPDGIPAVQNVELMFDEYEAIRLIDLMKYTHAQCAAQMDISRTTVTEIYESARAKIADSLINVSRESGKGFSGSFIEILGCLPETYRQTMRNYQESEIPHGETYLCNDALLDERHSAGNSVKNVGTQIYDHDSDLCQGDKPNDR